MGGSRQAAVPVPRAERLVQIRELLDEGLTHRQIAERLGCARSTVRNVLQDPDGSKQAARRERYRRACPSCGELMDGSAGFNGATVPRLCVRCERERIHDERRWTPDEIVAEIRRVAAVLGRTPKATDFIGKGVASGDVSIRTVARREFGSWRGALLAAGFDAPPVGKHERTPAMLENYRAAQRTAAREHHGATGRTGDFIQTNVGIEAHLLARLRQDAEALGVSTSELIRRAIDYWYG